METRRANALADERADKRFNHQPAGESYNNQSAGEPFNQQSADELSGGRRGPCESVARALPSIDSLTPDSDFTVFFQPKVDESLKRQALKQLLRDPRFNVMDRLDVYIDDYSVADPLPPGMLEQLVHARAVLNPPRTRVNERGEVVEATDALEATERTATTPTVTADINALPTAPVEDLGDASDHPAVVQIDPCSSPDDVAKPASTNDSSANHDEPGR